MARQALVAPPFPEDLGELWAVFEQLDTMREVGFHGLCHFTPSHIAEAGRLFGWQLEPHEVEALMTLDLAWMYPEPEPTRDAEPVPDAPWPVRKG